MANLRVRSYVTYTLPCHIFTESNIDFRTAVAERAWKGGVGNGKNVFVLFEYNEFLFCIRAYVIIMLSHEGRDLGKAKARESKQKTGVS